MKKRETVALENADIVKAIAAYYGIDPGRVIKTHYSYEIANPTSEELKMWTSKGEDDQK